MLHIPILTNFGELHPGYSLTTITRDQAWMFSSQGHPVSVYVLEPPHFKDRWPRPVGGEIVEKVPQGDLTDYRSKNEISEEHKDLAKRVRDFLLEEMAGEKIALVHDWIFTGWNLPYGLGLRMAAAQLPEMRWMHWVHSVPTMGFDWWRLKDFGPYHKIIYPNQTERLRVAEQYRTMLDEVKIIPHLVDLRTLWDFTEETCRFIDEHPLVMHADVMQVYPIGADRLRHKQLEKVITIFGHFKKAGYQVCLVCANQWATGRQAKEDVEIYYQHAEQNGLDRDREFIFTSEWLPEGTVLKEGEDMPYGTGIPRSMLRELYLVSNLMIFPTISETFGLIGPEAALHGVLMVMNKTLPMQAELHDCMGLYFDFGAYDRPFKPEIGWDEYLKQIAFVILATMRGDRAIMNKTICRRKFNMTTLYHTSYMPLIEESRLWGTE